MTNLKNLFSRFGHRISLALLTIVMVAGLSVATPNTASAEVELNLAGGWDGMLLKDSDDINNGGIFTLSVGYRFMSLVGIFIEQDLGFIKPESKISNDFIEIKLKGDSLFKGGTFATARLFLSFLMLETSLRVGVGAMYMQTPNYAEDDWQTWFAFRAGLGLALALGCFRVGAEFDYTLGSDKDNNFDGKDTTNFLSAKAFVGYLF